MAVLRVAIVGGGVSGLSAALALQRLMPRRQLTVIEQSARLGGVIRTDRVDGCTVEGGPDSFLASKPAGLELCREIGIEDELTAPREATRGSFVLGNGDLHRMPEGFSGLVPTQMEPLLESALFSAEGKERVAREPEIPARDDGVDETLGSFIERRFGREVYERLIEPLMAGIYAGDGKQLSLAATFPQLGEMERQHGSLLVGMGIPSPPGPLSLAGRGGGHGMSSRGDSSRAAAPERRGFLAPLDGMGRIIDALVARLSGVSFQTGTAVSRIDRRGDGFRLHLESGEALAVDGVILAVPAYAAASLIGHFDADLRDALSAIPYASTVTVTLAYPPGAVEHPLRGYGYVVPRAAGRPALACTWVTSKWRNRAPEGWTLLRVFLGRYGLPDPTGWSDEMILRVAQDELRATLGIEAPSSRHWIFRWQHAMPQYTLGHLDRLADIDGAVARIPHLALANNLRGVGIPDCIRSGSQAAQQVLKKHQNVGPNA